MGRWKTYVLTIFLMFLVSMVMVILLGESLYLFPAFIVNLFVIKKVFIKRVGEVVPKDYMKVYMLSALTILIINLISGNFPLEAFEKLTEQQGGNYYAIMIFYFLLVAFFYGIIGYLGGWIFLKITQKLRS